MIYSFETGMPEEICGESQEIEISETHVRDGAHALLWRYSKGSSIHIRNNVGYHPFSEERENQDRDNFVVWMYREKRDNTFIEISFLKKGKICCRFDFGQNFTGWRTCWVPYEDMTGQPEEEMDEIRFCWKGEESGSVWIDQIITAVPVDPRHPTPDYQVPFVNHDIVISANAHWTALLYFRELEKKNCPEAGYECTADRTENQIRTIQARMEKYILTRGPGSGTKEHLTKDEYAGLCASYEKYRLQMSDDGQWKGLTVDAACQRAVYPAGERERLLRITGAADIKDCSQLLLDTACAWKRGTAEQKEALVKRYIALLSHLWEQGWAEGSSLGTTHHLGYAMRGLYPSVLLMRTVLESAGLMKKAADMLAWFSGRGRIFRREVRWESMDTLNTLLQGILYSILLEKDTGKQAAYLHTLRKWLNGILRPAPGLKGPFKVDGSAFHHAGHYPAYAMGGFQGLTPVIYALSGTEFQIDAEAFETVRKSLFMMRIYCNRYDWPVSMSARHPVGRGEMSRISSLDPFYYMTISGEKGEGGIDRKMAGALLRLAEYEDYPPAEEIRRAGYEAENAPEGSFSMNYASALIHRRGEWMAAVRGHSRYLWANETYEGNNLYGRYVTYGSLQLLGSGTPVNNLESGFRQEGWDWNCYPGTTSVILPFEKLRQRVCVADAWAGREEMLLSDETYAGGVTLGGWNGLYAMKLHGHDKYDGSLKARKSWFFFDDRIICLGSDIEDARPEYDTVTTLYQYYMGEDEADAGQPELCPYEKELILSDPGGNCYRIPEGYQVYRFRGRQESRDQNSGAVTYGVFEKAWMNHGKAPKNAGYEYMLRIQPGLAEKEGESYQVLCRTRQLHAVKDMETGICGYAFFEPCRTDTLDYADEQCSEMIQEADRACLIMYRCENGKLSISFCDPDLRFYEGEEKDQRNADGTQKEVSVYSRRWIADGSIGKWTRVVLKGKWEEGRKNRWNGKAVRIQREGNRTVLWFYGQDGQVTECELQKEEKK